MSMLKFSRHAKETEAQPAAHIQLLDYEEL
jgi:hypothetical protein